MKGCFRALGIPDVLRHPSPPDAGQHVADLTELGLGLWDTGASRWTPGKLTSSGVDVGESHGAISVHNKTDHMVKLEFLAEATGDFEFVVEQAGARGISIRPSTGEDYGVGTKWKDQPDDRSHLVVFRRRGTTVSLLVNGNPTPVDFYKVNDCAFPGHLGVSIAKGERAQIRKLYWRQYF